MGLIIKNGIKYFGDNSVQLTQAQYDALSQAEKLNGTIYYITDANNASASYAAGVTYDNTSSGLSATNVQAAIDEVVEAYTPKVAILTGSMDCSYADSSTIGYRSILSESVDLATLPNYPTDRTIIGIAVAYAYVGNKGEYYHIAQLNIVGTNVHCNAKISGTVRFAIRVIYI